MNSEKRGIVRLNVDQLSDDNELVSMHLTFLLAGIHESTPHSIFLEILKELKTTDDSRSLAATFQDILEDFYSNKENDIHDKKIQIRERMPSVNSELTEQRISPPPKEKAATTNVDRAASIVEVDGEEVDEEL